ncbi:MAG: discoidin domain-containing protein [Clostridia bacterium]|nr:discoidin domain-containing protein [Clostridia bacterium]
MKGKLTALLTAAALLAGTFPAVTLAADEEPLDLTVYESSVTASDNETGNVPTNVIDGKLSTKWAASGGNQWLKFQLAETTTVEKIGISFTSGDARVYTFRIETSLDNENWTIVYDGKSSGTTAEIEYFTLEKTEANFVRFVGQGSNVNTWNNINELVGLTPIKIPYNLTVDGKLKPYKTPVALENGIAYISACELFDTLKLEYTYDEAAKALTAKYGDKQLTANFSTGKVSGLPDCTAEDLLLHENGTPMVSPRLVVALTGSKAEYVDAEKTVKIETEEYARIMAAYAKIDDYYLKVFDWLVELYDPESGGFYNSVSGATYEGFYPSLEASGFVVAMLGRTESGAIVSMPDQFRQKLLNFFVSCQNPDTGYFEEPWPKSPNYNDRAKMRVIEQVTSKIPTLGGKVRYALPSERNVIEEGVSDYNIDYNLALEEALADETRADMGEVEEEQAENEDETEDEVAQTESTYFNRDTVIDLPDGVPSYCSSVNAFIENAASRNWATNSWTAGDLLYEDLSYILMLDESLQQPYIDAAIEWLNEHQDPETHYWAQPGDYGFNAVSGAFKVVRIYDRFNLEPPNSMGIAESVLKTLRGGYSASAACYVRNPADTLVILCGHDPEVKKMVQEHECEIIELYAKMIGDMFHEDGGASTYMNQSQNIFGGLSVGNMVCEGDMDGTQQMWLARTRIAALFGREVDNSHLAEYYDEFWNKILTKEPIVKKKYDAAPGVVYEQDFEEIEDFYALTHDDWGFRTGDCTVETKNIYNKTDQYLKLNDNIESDVHSARKAFPRVYSKVDIECSLMFDRERDYTDKGNSVSDTNFRVGSGELNPVRISAVDTGSDCYSLRVHHASGTGTAYTEFATVRKGEWFDMKFSLEYDRDGKLHVKYYLNGKLQPNVTDLVYDQGMGYIDGLDVITSGLRKCYLGLDNIKVTAY